ncbi:MAG: glutamine--fructose-6-phosphate transaminase (isomerizing) [Candidatus Dadabacteria bacterium]|nr:glutamine--fructose-6-phosphate transaminase (isomerizing) [Candidatus Dadabacteria bacterium]
MCGIVGYVGAARRACDVVRAGLEKLDNRGYDSAGICVMGEGGATVFKSPGKIDRLVREMGSAAPSGGVGIGHTRWATQGDPLSRANAHPHTAGAVSVVHNGVVENWRELRDELEAEGGKFLSDTDTETIAHLIDKYHGGGCGLLEAVRKSFERVRGCSAVAVVSEKEPDTIVVARRFSPIVLAEAGDERFVASDAPALAEWCDEVTVLEDGDFAVLKPSGVTITDSDGNTVSRPKRAVGASGAEEGKGGFRHYMLKEIHDQPHAVSETLRGRIGKEADFEGIDPSAVERVVFVGCGTSHYASIAGRYMIESLARLPADAEIASEFRYRRPRLGPETLVIAVSQSGETADTSLALAEAAERGAATALVTNNPMGKMVDEAGAVILTRAGREFSVASTKTFTTQVAVFCALALFLGKARGVTGGAAEDMEKELRSIAGAQSRCLALNDEIAEVAAEFARYSHLLYLGRGLGYPVALEGALKLKEVSYIHAEGAAAGEMKHGPIALIDEKIPVVFVFPSRSDPSFEKMLSNMAEVKARRGRVLAVTPAGDAPHLDAEDRVIQIPECGLITNPLVSVIALQLLAYHIARTLGKDVDQPRNLAKVVSVE